MNIYNALESELTARCMMYDLVFDVLVNAIIVESDDKAQWPGLLAEVVAGIDGETSVFQGVVDEALTWLPYDPYDYLED